MKEIALSLVLILLAAGGPARAQGDTARGHDIHFRGPIVAINRSPDGSISGLTIQVNLSTIGVALTSWTQLWQGSGFKLRPEEIRVNDFVAVDGFFTGSGVIYAGKIHVESSDPVLVEGPIESILGPTLRINGIEFRLDPESRIRLAGSEVPATEASLRSGLAARVRARMRQGELAVVELEIGARTVESEPLRLEGVVRKLEGQLLSVDVGVRVVDALVAIDEETVFTGFVRPGVRVEIEGRFLPGQSLVRAIRVAVDENENGNLYDEADRQVPGVTETELAGAIQKLEQSVSGTVVRIQVGGRMIQIDSKTIVTHQDGIAAALADLRVGLEVEVYGVLRADNSLQASKIVIREDSPKEEPPPEPEKVSLSGPIEKLQRSQSGEVRQIEVQGEKIRLDSATRILKGDLEVSDDELKVGQMVGVSGLRENGESILAETIRIED